MVLHSEDEDLHTVLRRGAAAHLTVQPEAIRSFGARRSRTRRIIAASIATAAAVAVVAIGTTVWHPVDNIEPAGSEEQTPVLRHQHQPVSFTAALDPQAVLKRRGECLYLEDAPILWPPDAQWNKNSESVTFAHEGERVTVRVGGNFPAGVGVGVVPVGTTRNYTTADTRARVSACLRGGRQDVAIIAE